MVKVLSGEILGKGQYSTGAGNPLPASNSIQQIKSADCFQGDSGQWLKLIVSVTKA